MRKSAKLKLIIGALLLFLFAIWTALILVIDVKSIGPLESSVGFAALNGWFHSLTGVNMLLYNLTDIFSLVPFAVALGFAIFGLIQLIKRKSFIKVDFDILMLGAHYNAVAFSYLVFEILALNYRPILIEGILEASYPSSTTMLALTVMITFAIQMNLRIKNIVVRTIVITSISAFAAFMVIARIISGVHWITDIIGGAILSAGLIMIYCALYKFYCKK